MIKNKDSKNAFYMYKDQKVTSLMIPLHVLIHFKTKLLISATLHL